jgi:hypothetical protein
MDEMESEPLDYATPAPLETPNPPWRRVIFALSGVLFLAVATVSMTGLIVMSNSPIPLPEISVPLFLAVVVFGVMAIRAFIESIRTKRR